MEDSALYNWILTHWFVSILIGTFIYCNIGYFITWFSYGTIHKYATFENGKIKMKSCFRTWLVFPCSVLFDSKDGWVEGPPKEAPDGIEVLVNKELRAKHMILLTLFWPLKIVWFFIGPFIAAFILGMIYLIDNVTTIAFWLRVWKIVTIPIRILLPPIKEID